MKFLNPAARLLLFFALVFSGALPGHATGQNIPPPAAGPPSILLPSEGEKIWINDNFYFTYGYDKRPALGPLVVKIQLFSRDGTRSTALGIKGSADMPSMRGAHYTGDQPFRLSKKGDYLLPVDVVMPGDWEIQLIFTSGDAVIYRGHILFDV
jgi:hypothetical protein